MAEGINSEVILYSVCGLGLNLFNFKMLKNGNSL